ncbi:MAG: Nramp family divalent metal transporter, partial [Thaumarchaeota archaeon]|nr:Nramp family divalent metal transporter [Nitrososphaerota archaeon]
IVLSLAAAVNVSIMIMAAVAFNPTHPEINTISEAFKILIPLFGVSAATIFIITLLSSGIASSVVGTLAGQSIMEGLLGKKVNPWLRRLVTRFVNVIPTTIAILLGFDPLHILVYSQVILSILIPLPMIPLLILTRDRNLMGQFVNRKITTVVASMFVGIIMLLNIYLLATFGF